MTIEKIRNFLSDEDLASLNDKDEAVHILTKAILAMVRHDIKNRRKALKMRQSDLAEESGLQQPAISRIETGIDDHFSLTTLKQVAAALDMIVVIDIVKRTEIVSIINSVDKLNRP